MPPSPLSAAPPGPHFVAVNNKNEIVVTDFHNHSVKVSAAVPIPMSCGDGHVVTPHGDTPR